MSAHLLDYTKCLLLIIRNALHHYKTKWKQHVERQDGTWKSQSKLVHKVAMVCKTGVYTSEAATRGVLWKKVLLEFSQNS